jgi:hypothetical protein
LYPRTAHLLFYLTGHDFSKFCGAGHAGCNDARAANPRLSFDINRPLPSARTESGCGLFVDRMDRARKLLTLLMAAAMALPAGCGWQRRHSFEACVPPGIYEKTATEIEYPAETDCTQASYDESLSSPHPWTIATQGTPDYQDISLEEVIQLTLANSQVLRDVGGAVVRAPDATRTTLGPAIAESSMPSS